MTAPGYPGRQDVPQHATDAVVGRENDAGAVTVSGPDSAIRAR